MNTIRLCPGCGSPLTSDAPGGLCPQCLLKTQVIGEDDLVGVQSATPVPGGVFGDYRILRLLGHGGMGEVYEAEHLVTARRVALKVMRHALASEQDRKRFLREGRLAASVNHPNVVYVHGSEEIDGSPAIAMELVHGGTLKDRLKQGPLAITAAAEAALQIIDGLEAAHAAGVLHRDIKPANCFVASDGIVKVGDFGLSVSTLARGESLITATGAVMGTPAYASPEQLRGEELDVRSDIYSVGATLYHLLTGKTPFNATDFIKLITEVLDKQPAAPKALRDEIPTELSKVILRCLAKDRKARFQSYAELRDALLPFRAEEVVPAHPAMRFLATALDDIIAYAPIWACLIYTSVDPLDRLTRERTWEALLVWLGFYTFYLAYYTISEGLWGAAIGKSICGLRVVGKDRQSPGVLRALLRVLVYSSPWVLPSLLLIAWMLLSGSTVPERNDWIAGSEEVLITDWVWFPLTFLLFVTMRRRNGFAALQDLVSGTRVIVRPKSQKRPMLSALAQPPRVPASAASSFGPYAARDVLWTNGAEQLVLGFDSALQRKVWLHLRPLDAAPLSESRRDLSRAARLRWINRGRTDTQAWDAYEAPDGQPFLNVVQRPQPWNAVRFWLLDLATEFSAAVENPQDVPPLGLSHLWITSAGNCIILEFAAPGLASGFPSQTSTGLQKPDSSYTSLNSPDSLNTRTSLDPSSIQNFLSTFARVALEGSAGRSPAGSESIAALVPLHARSFLGSLLRGGFEEARFIVGNLKSLIAKPAEVSRSRRLVSIVSLPVMALLLFGSMAALLSIDRIRWDRAWSSMAGSLPSMRSAAEIYEHRVAETAKGNWVPENVEVIGVYIVAHYSEWITNSTFWSSPVGKLLSNNHRQALQDALAKFPEPTTAQIARAEQQIPRRLVEHDKEQKQMIIEVSLGLLICFAIAVGFLEIIGAAAFKSSPLLRLFGMSVVRRDGLPVGRWHLVGRALLTWGVVIGCSFLFSGLGMYLPEATGPIDRWSALAVMFLALAILVVANVFAVLRPNAGLHDLLVRTRLVPV